MKIVYLIFLALVISSCSDNQDNSTDGSEKTETETQNEQLNKFDKTCRIIRDYFLDEEFFPKGSTKAKFEKDATIDFAKYFCLFYNSSIIETSDQVYATFTNNGALYYGFRTESAIKYNQDLIDEYEKDNKNMLFVEIKMKDIDGYLKDKDIQNAFKLNDIELTHESIEDWYKVMYEEMTKITTNENFISIRKKAKIKEDMLKEKNNY